MLGRQRVLFTLGFSFLLSLPLGLGWKSGYLSLLIRALALGLIAMLAFGLFEQWPKRMPNWFARWVLQVLGVAVSIPVGTFIIYVLSTHAGAPPFWHDSERLQGFSGLCGLGLFIAPWTALAALVRQKDALARHQALAFELERSELERQALDARLRLLQAQVAPHFLFNTLANVQALVDTGSPQASAVLRSLIAYLRAAVPRLHEPATTLGQELELVQAYLELMHMRMPDRLQFALHVDDAALGAALSADDAADAGRERGAPRHRSERGGRPHRHRRCERRGDRCLVRVVDTGVGLRPPIRASAPGFRRCASACSWSSAPTRSFACAQQAPHGVCAELDLPARGATA